MIRKGAIVLCLTCGIKKYFPHCRIRDGRKFCSRKCGYTKEWKKLLSEKRKLNNPGGFKEGNKINLGRTWTKEQRIKNGLKWIGSNNPKWKNGISIKNKTERKLLWGTIKYKDWRKAILKRDKYTCQICRINKGIILHVDHIKSWRDYPRLRFKLTNGRTLCWECHKKTETYGNPK